MGVGPDSFATCTPVDAGWLHRPEKIATRIPRRDAVPMRATRFAQGSSRGGTQSWSMFVGAGARRSLGKPVAFGMTASALGIMTFMEPQG
jgi:hypothetical protein